MSTSRNGDSGTDAQAVPSQRLGFHHVQAIYSVVLSGSVTSAAERLSLTQPALSNRLRDAEERIGFDLFERRAGRLVPTPNAMLLFDEIERSFIGLDQINKLCTRVRRQQRRKISIVCTPTFGAVVLPRMLATFTAAEPDTFFSIESRPASHVAALVSSRKADVGFALDVPRVPGVDSELLAELPVVCYLSPAHRLARPGANVTATDLAQEPMISLSRNEGVEQIISNAFHECGTLPPVVAECPAALSACAMVSANVGFTLFDALPAALLPRTALSVHAFEPETRLTYRAYWPGSRSLPPSIARLIELARKEIIAASIQWKRDSR